MKYNALSAMAFAMAGVSLAFFFFLSAQISSPSVVITLPA